MPFEGVAVIQTRFSLLFRSYLSLYCTFATQPGPCAQQFKDCNLLTQKLCTNNFKERTGKNRKKYIFKSMIKGMQPMAPSVDIKTIY